MFIDLSFTIFYRCLLEKDPIAQKHAARIEQMRGTYDSMGNRLPPVHQPIKRGRRRKKRTETSELHIGGNNSHTPINYVIGKLNFFTFFYYAFR